ncbi:MAG: hypothetical protein AAFO99_01080 [Bacteroidota bacterium]
MGKLLIFGCTVLLLFACKGNKNQDVGDGSKIDVVSEELPQVFKVNARAKSMLEEWPEFNALETSFNAIYKADNREDLTFAVEDLLEKEKLLAKSKYPETFDKSQIKSRQKVVKTFMLKVEAGLDDRTDVMEPMKEMVQAYNAMRNQFNVLVNNTLDTKLILDDE